MRAPHLRRLTNCLLGGALACSALACAKDESPPRPSSDGRPATRDGGSASSGRSDGGQGGTGMLPVDEEAPGGSVSSGALAKSRRPRLQWKRYSAFEADLARAFALPAGELCTELGTESCIHGVHLVPLGGHEPFTTGMLESASDPLATTPTVVERIVLSVCNKRVELDRAAGMLDAKVFGQLALDAPAPAPDSAAINDLITNLYRRLLARDPQPLELSSVAELAVDAAGQPLGGADFAKLACFAVGSSSEFLFF